jgi:hypothetical protein
MAVPRFWREMPVRYNLIGSHCTGCDMYHYPPRAMCSSCHRESLGKMEEHKFAGTGQIVANTVVYQPQQGYEMHGPYPMAMIEMDEGARITAQIVDVAPRDQAGQATVRGAEEQLFNLGLVEDRRGPLQRCIR